MSKKLFLNLICVCISVGIMQIGVYAKDIAQVNTKDGITTEIHKSPAKANLLSTIQSDLSKLPVPTGLQWGELIPGNLSWNCVPEAEGEYRLIIYKDGEEFFRTNWSGLFPIEGSSRVQVSFCSHILDSGRYTFQVASEGGIQTSDYSPLSSAYVYVKPQSALSAPTNAHWDDNNPALAVWDSVPNATGYYIDLYNDGNSVGSTWGSFGTEYDLMSWMEDPGVYTFKVRALSGNIEVCAHSEFSAFSDGYNSTNVAEQVNNTLISMLDDFDAGNIDADDVLDSLKLINLDDLAVSMQTNDDVLNNLKSLEQVYASEKNINVSNRISDEVKDKIDASKVSIVGAALNAVSGISNMSLNFSPPNQEIVVDESQYKNVVQVEIKLAGAAETGDLAVPVRITMPIPTGVSQSRLEILHYHSDGTYETISPIEFNYDGTISFTLTSFSDFAFANTIDLNDYESTITQLSYSNVTGETKASIVLTNNTDFDKKALMVVATYNSETGKLLYSNITPVEILSNNDYFVDKTFTCQTGQQNIRMKVFIWQDGLTIEPISYPDEEQTYKLY